RRPACPRVAARARAYRFPHGPAGREPAATRGARASSTVSGRRPANCFPATIDTASPTLGGPACWSGRATMADWRPAARGHRLRMTIEALLAIGLALMVASGLPGGPGANDRWGSLVGAADREASTPRTADPDAARRARIRYLLAFHDAQDAA